MSDTYSSNQNNPTMHAIRRLDSRFEAAGEEIDDFMLRQARGERPDPNMFQHLLERRMTAQEAMQAQFKLHEKPLKLVLNEVK